MKEVRRREESKRKGGGRNKNGGGRKEEGIDWKVKGRGRKEKGNRFLNKLPGTTHIFKGSKHSI